MSNKQLVLTNLNVLLEAVKAYPEKQFNLSNYRDETECGTLFCVAGLAATLPHFNAQGMYFDKDEWSEWVIRMDADRTVSDDEATDPLFGPESWYNMFSTYGSGNRDVVLGAYAEGDSFHYSPLLTHKELAVRRIKAQIAAVEGAE